MKRLPKMGALGIIGIIALITGRTILHDGRMDRHAERLADEALKAKIDYVLSDESGKKPLSTKASHKDRSQKRAPPPSNLQQNHKLQLNPSYLAEWSPEDHFIDYMKVKGYPDDYRWQFIFQDKYWNTKQADEAGYIDPITGDPKRIPSGLLELQGPLMLFNIKNFPEWYAGDWVLTWEGSGDAYFYRPEVKIKSNEKNRIVFTLPSKGTDQFRARFRNVRSPIHNLKLYRLRHEEQMKSGGIWNPDFLSYVKQYDIVRTMVLQSTNTTTARHWDDIALPSDPHFLYRGPVISEREISPFGRYGVPYEHLFSLADKTDTELWLNIPVQIGSNMPYSDAGDNFEKILQNATTNARSIVASPAWDEFADEFTKRLVASNYPKDKPLYIELGNEIWNYGWPFAINSKYTEGIAKGYDPNQNLRYGYGILSARMIVAFEEALTDTGYTPIYVIGSQTAIPDFTRVAYQGMKDYLRSQNLKPDQWISKTGISLTTYHGGADAYKALVTPRNGESLIKAWEREIILDADDLKKRLHAHYTQSPAHTVSTKKWVIAMWQAHKKIADQYKAPLIGAYEGGSHDNPPLEFAESKIFLEWWKDYHWGEWGTDVVRQINQAIVDEYPGIILSDFTSMGVIGDLRAPWFDRSYTEETPMSLMWREFDRVE